MKELISKDELSSINEAGRLEKLASQTYEHFANIARMKGLFGCTKYFLNESKQESEHFQKLASFLNDVGETICMPALEEMDDKYETLDEMFEHAYEMELELLEYYEGLLDDFPARFRNILLEMVEIQVKSVGEYADLIARLSLTNDDILIFDQELGYGL